MIQALPNLVDNMAVVVALMRAAYPSLDLTKITLDSTKVTLDNGLAPFYMYGHNIEISNRLLAKDKDPINKYQKYPLVALRLDAPEEVDGGMVHYNLNIAILSDTSKGLTSEQRQAQVFKPTLYPLYHLFIYCLKKSGLFLYKGVRPSHTKVDRYFWGTPSGGKSEENIFSDPIDAIEILNLVVSSKIKC